jgi:hypothetical protein
MYKDARHAAANRNGLAVASGAPYALTANGAYFLLAWQTHMEQIAAETI